MAGPKTAPLEPKIVDRLLGLLANDDEFRELFQKDPVAAMEQVGYQPPVMMSARVAASTDRVSVAGCIGVRQLASKEQIQAAHDELKSMLLAGLSQTSPQLDASASTE